MRCYIWCFVVLNPDFHRDGYPARLHARMVLPGIILTGGTKYFLYEIFGSMQLIDDRSHSFSTLEQHSRLVCAKFGRTDLRLC